VKIIVASALALGLMAASAPTTVAEAGVGVAVHVGPVGVGFHAGRHHRRHHVCGAWGWRHHARYCRRWYWRYY
jgi:hypothetical protein